MDGYLALSEVVFDLLGEDVVHDLVVRLYAVFCKLSETGVVCSDVSCRRVVTNDLSVDVVLVVIIHDEEEEIEVEDITGTITVVCLSRAIDVSSDVWWHRCGIGGRRGFGGTRR